MSEPKGSRRRKLTPHEMIAAALLGVLLLILVVNAFWGIGEMRVIEAAFWIVLGQLFPRTGESTLSKR